jgi:hypothetical protein
MIEINVPNKQDHRMPNSAAGQPAKIEPKLLIENRFSTLKGCFSAAEKRFFPAGREIQGRSTHAPEFATWNPCHR